MITSCILLDRQSSHQCGDWRLDLLRDEPESFQNAGLSALLNGLLEYSLQPLMGLSLGSGADDIPSPLAVHLPFGGVRRCAVSSVKGAWKVRATTTWSDKNQSYPRASE